MWRYLFNFNMPLFGVVPTQQSLYKAQANGYAALMELEATMLGNKSYIGHWSIYDRPALDSTPFSEVYLVDSGNVAQQCTSNINDFIEACL